MPTSLDSSPMERLDRDERLRLLRFVCSFAWTDLKVTTAEREFVERLCDRNGLEEAERQLVTTWLAAPPPLDDLDPLDIPQDHRQMFVDAARDLLEADGVVPSEAETFAVFEELTRAC